MCYGPLAHTELTQISLLVTSFGFLVSDSHCGTSIQSSTFIESADSYRAALRPCKFCKTDKTTKPGLGAVAGQTLSLNEIEHGVIRTRWDEPRVHACVNCASRSCPDLLGQAYRGDLCGNQPVS